jgi:hypothetical protein
MARKIIFIALITLMPVTWGSIFLLKRGYITLRPVDLVTSWRYETAHDNWSGKDYPVAKVWSTNIVRLNLPYEGAQRALLGVHKHPRYGQRVTLQIRRGQFMGDLIWAQFDNDPLTFSYETDTPADGTNNTLFIEDPNRAFIERLRRTKVIRLRTTIFQEGERIFEFNVEGLKL